MHENREILAAYENARTRGESTVLATVVKVTGSAYRRPGARMLIGATGALAGTVSGGCLEADVAEKAISMLYSGPARLLVEYDTTREDEVMFGVGLGCSGSTHIFLEVIDSSSTNNTLNLIADLIGRNEPAVLPIIVSTQGNLGTLQRQIAEDAQKLLHARRCKFVSYASHNCRAEVFHDYIDPPVSLVIFGAGHDAQPLVNLAKQIGWDVSLVDDRPAYLTKERFPQADDLRCLRLDRLAVELKLPVNAAAVVMTHSFSRDLQILDFLLRSSIGYIGMLGPKLRTHRLIQDLKEKGLSVSPERLERVWAPIGLDIGAETPAEIALSVLAEIQTVRSDRSGSMLKDRAGPIHDQFLSEGGSSSSTATGISEVVACPQ